MKHRTLCGLLIASSLLAGCTAPQKVVEAPYSSTEYAVLKTEGTATVQGQIFMKTRGGDVKYGAGSTIFFAPVTSYNLTRFQAVQARQQLKEPDPRAQPYNRTTVADGSGNFSFENVAAGEYLIFGSVIWEAPSPYGLSTQGGMISMRFIVKEGEVKKIIMTH
ncbi:hypothetical protein [Pseudomonas frederiksbergensis]|uniref:Lipoprotein n=1 Tax=Pseudomonas frederiksbergensis TaxID=104087 RepID=A0A6L5BT11_9PSED|nr:hypothetical protein [Pseudomonas frederiksbergensis]KAF2391548.1 hypothetical protein FX983_06033 [Pseudomonas frederiksbergensis]